MQNNPSNCGACGNNCPAAANGTAVCVAGGCNYVCSAGFRDCNGAAADGCEVNITNTTSNCGACGNVCPVGNICSAGVCRLAPVGQYNVSAGPAWGTNPPTYTCQEACALLFGGVAASYQCSTVAGSINRMANTSIWGIGGCAVVADTFKRNVNYNCGSANCAQSAYVADNCNPGTNYCFR
jgi:hypothetical protein